MLGVVEDYRLLRIPDGESVRLAIECGGERYDASEGETTQEMACHLNWYYLMFCEPDDPNAAELSSLPETVRAACDREEN